MFPTRRRRSNDPTRDTTVDANGNITLDPYDLLAQISTSLRRNGILTTVVVPPLTNHRSALMTLASMFNTVTDPPMISVSPSPEILRERLRRIAAGEPFEAPRSFGPPKLDEYLESTGRPIHRQDENVRVPFPPVAPESTREHVIENVTLTDQSPLYPVSDIRPAFPEEELPRAKGSFLLLGLGPPSEAPERYICGGSSLGFLWHAGAPYTMIAEETLVERMREYLQDPVHDKYRSNGCTRLYMDARIALSNRTVDLNAIVWVVPVRFMPNQYRGLILGQQQCIERITCNMIPRGLLPCRADSQERWGDIIVESYVDGDDNVILC